ncbi:MAG: biopolymer transporter ExbD [Gammaproteobacteria bacterium]|nr:biopolymer transporter ExbD [Gammaproteobacteria bacterium]
MKQSLRARRMAKQHRRHAQRAKLNLVSLMDIFTIIVFFLLMNTGEVEVLQNHKSITLPESVAAQKPGATLVVMVNAEELMIEGEVVARVADVLDRDEPTIAGLSRALQARAALLPKSAAAGAAREQAVTIMGDEAVPYALLKKVMTTCAAADYRNISLAVTKVASAAVYGDAVPTVAGG